MSAVERLEDRRGETPPSAIAGSRTGEAASIEAVLAQTPAKSARRSCVRCWRWRLMWRATAGRAILALDLADGRRDHHAGGAGRGAADDRFRLHPEGIALINSYFSVMIAVVAVLALRQRVAILSGDDHRRAHRRRSPARRVRASDVAVAGVLRFRAQRRTDLAADRRYHPDQIRRRRLGLDRAAQCDAVHRRHRDDGDHEPAAVRPGAARHSR